MEWDTYEHPDHLSHDPVAAPSPVTSFGSEGWYDAMPPPGTPCDQYAHVEAQPAEQQATCDTFELLTVRGQPRADAIRNDLYCYCMYGLGLAMIYWFIRFLRRGFSVYLRNNKTRSQKTVMIFFAIVATCAAQKSGTFFFPKTETDLIYIADRGSYVTNDFIHVDFTRHPAVPSSAPLYIDYFAMSDTNMANVSTLVATTFAQFSVPTNITFSAATNYNFVCYTTWTPGPTVHTNGVLHANWGTASGSMANEAAARGLFWAIPVQTEIIENGKTTFPPKTQPIVIEANLLNELNEESQNE